MSPTAGGDKKTQAEACATRPLPLWRLIAGIGVLACLLGVIAALAPLYIDNFRLGRYVRALAAAPDFATTPDEILRSQVLARARQLDLPVQPSDVKVTHHGGKLQLQANYRVRTDLALYPVDLHFHPEASSR
jgi:hypothetical protein